MYQIKVSHDVKKLVKLAAAERGITVKQLVDQIIREALQQPTTA